jgi:2-dehydropantoate 2-reductase
MKKIAVVGTGTIGHLVGGFLSHGGHDVTVVSQFRRNATEVFAQKGITVKFEDQVFTTPVKAAFWQDLTEADQFDMIMITGSADFTADAVEKMKPHAAPNAFWSSFQNGIPEDVIVPLVGKENVIPVVCFAGGRTPELGTVVTHDGFFVIGEMNGQVTPRLEELKEILSCAKRVEISKDIMSSRWEKLCMAVTTPPRNVSGLETYENEDLRICIARCAVEYYALAQACGAKPRQAAGVPFEEWGNYVNGCKTPEETETLIKTLSSVFMPSKEELGDMAWKIDPMELAGSLVPDHRLPMEGHHTMGYVVSKAKELGIPVPTYDFLYPYVYRVAHREIQADPSYLRLAVEATDPYYQHTNA